MTETCEISQSFDKTFHQYLQNLEIYNLHNQKLESYMQLPDKFQNLPHILCYGPSGVGKYSQSLKIIEKYSSSKLKYEKKIQIPLLKDEVYMMKISDIHFEVDMETLGCNAKTLWQQIYNGIFNIMSLNNHTMFSVKSKTRQTYNGIIMCKNFHNISYELLDVFYSYMINIRERYNIRFVLLSESISFIPQNILDTCITFNYGRPSKGQYAELVSKLTNNPYKKSYNKLSEPNCLLNIENEIQNVVQLDYCKKLCNPIIELIIQNNVNYSELREHLYTIMINNVSIVQVVYYLIHYCLESNLVPCNRIGDCLQVVYSFYKLYNNNYRPIFHLEKLVLELIRIIHELQ